MTHSDLALAGIACAAVPGMQPVSVQEWRRPEASDPSPAQRALIEDATGRRWVVVVPQTVAGAAELERNDALTRQLGKHVPFKVPVASGFTRVGSAGRAAVFPYVEGSAINFHRIPGGPGLSSAIGRAVAAVHNMPADFFDEFGVPSFDAAGHRQRRLADLDRAAETGLVPNSLLSRWEQAFDTPTLWHFNPTPIHGSLNGWAFHVAFSDDEAATARVLALTSWEHAAVADPAEDFATLVKQATPAAVESVLESYTLARAHRPDRNLLVRARLAGEMSLLRGLAAAVGAGDQEAVDARVDDLRKLSRLTSADDPLVPAVAPTAEAPVTEAPVTEAPVAETSAAETPAAESSEVESASEEAHHDAAASADQSEQQETAPTAITAEASDQQDETAPVPNIESVPDSGPPDEADPDITTVIEPVAPEDSAEELAAQQREPDYALEADALELPSEEEPDDGAEADGEPEPEDGAEADGEPEPADPEPRVLPQDEAMSDLYDLTPDEDSGEQDQSGR